MNALTISLVACALLFAGMCLAAFVSHRTGRRLVERHPETKDWNTGTVDAAILSLLGLLTAFTFSSAYSRYDFRRQLIVQEVNAIGDAYLRLDLLSPEDQGPLRAKFREYAESRLKIWELLPDREAALAEHARSEEIQQAIWSDAISASKNAPHPDAGKLLLPALNEMIDITTTRLIAVQAHPPLIIFLLLGVLSVAAAGIVGFGMVKAERLSYLHAIGFAAVVSFALFVILDIEYPRHGLVTLDMAHELLRELEQKMQ